MSVDMSRTKLVLQEIFDKRERQITYHGWTPEHDDQHDSFEMAEAAACYARTPRDRQNDEEFTNYPVCWPWDAKWWRPEDNRENLMKAISLLVAEVERLDRAENKSLEEAIIDRF